MRSGSCRFLVQIGPQPGKDTGYDVLGWERSQPSLYEDCGRGGLEKLNFGGRLITSGKIAMDRRCITDHLLWTPSNSDAGLPFDLRATEDRPARSQEQVRGRLDPAPDPRILIDGIFNGMRELPLKAVVNPPMLPPAREARRGRSPSRPAPRG